MTSASAASHVESPNTVTAFIAARGTAILGDQLVTFFVPVAVFAATRSVSISGLAFLIQWLPRIISMPLSGVLVDRFPQRRQLVVVDAVRAVVLLIAALSGSVPVMVIASGVATLCNGHSTVAVETLLGREVRQDQYTRMQSRFQAVQQLMTILGPTLGGLLLLIGSPWIGLTCIAGVFLLAAIWTGLGFRTMGVQTFTVPGEPFSQQLRTGFTTVRRLPAVVLLIGITIAVNLTGSFALAALPSILIGSLDQPESIVAIVSAGATILSLIAALIAGKITRTRKVEILVPLMAILLIASAATMPFASELALMAVAYAFWSAGVTVFAIWMRTWRVRLIPSERLGAALGVFSSLILVTAPIAGVVLSAAGPAIGPQPSLGLLSIISAVVVVPLFIAFKRRTATWQPPEESGEPDGGSAR